MISPSTCGIPLPEINESHLSRPATAKAAAAKPEDEKLAAAAEAAAQAAKDAADGTKIPETFKDYLQKYVYGCKDQDDLLNVIGGSRLMDLKNEPHLGYSTRH